MATTCNRCDEPAMYFVEGPLLSDFEYLCGRHYEQRKEDTCTKCGLEKKLIIIDDEKRLCPGCLQEEKDDLFSEFTFYVEGILRNLERRAGECLRADEIAREKSMQLCGCDDYHFRVGYLRQELAFIAGELETICKNLARFVREAKQLL